MKFLNLTESVKLILNVVSISVIKVKFTNKLFDFLALDLLKKMLVEDPLDRISVLILFLSLNFIKS